MLLCLDVRAHATRTVTSAVGSPDPSESNRSPTELPSFLRDHSDPDNTHTQQTQCAQYSGAEYICSGSDVNFPHTVGSLCILTRL
ncbi:unnamed protein product [Arctogadus glacialis]